jgi:hypothetical protein
MDFVHDDSGTHRVTGRRPPTANDEEDDILFADEPDDDEDDGLPIADEPEEEDEPDPLDDPEPEPEPKAARQRRPDPEVDRLVREAQQQREQFSRLQAEIAQERLFKAQAELSAVKSHGALVASQYDEAKRQYQEAVELGETGKLTELQERLNDLRHQQRQINDFTQTRERQLQNPQAFVPPEPQYAPPPAPKVNPLALEWAKKNKWFGNTANQRHAALTGAAYALDKVLIDQGYNPHDPNFYKELDKRLRETMNANVRKQRQTVAGVSSRQAPQARAGRRPLTGREKAMAAKLGVQESDYAQYVDM